jgi:hypothetical protein
MHALLSFISYSFLSISTLQGFLQNSSVATLRFLKELCANPRNVNQTRGRGEWKSAVFKRVLKFKSF